MVVPLALAIADKMGPVANSTPDGTAQDQIEHVRSSNRRDIAEVAIGHRGSANGHVGERAAAGRGVVPVAIARTAAIRIGKPAGNFPLGQRQRAACLHGVSAIVAGLPASQGNGVGSDVCRAFHGPTSGGGGEIGIGSHACERRRADAAQGGAALAGPAIVGIGGVVIDAAGSCRTVAAGLVGAAAVILGSVLRHGRSDDGHDPGRCRQPTTAASRGIVVIGIAAQRTVEDGHIAARSIDAGARAERHRIAADFRVGVDGQLAR